EVDHAKARIGRELIVEHPVGYTIQAMKGLARTLLGTQRTETAEITAALTGGAGLNPAIGILALGSAFLLVGGSAFGALLALRRRDTAVLVTLVIPLAYMLAVGSGMESDARFRVPLVPGMAIMAAYALGALTASAPRDQDDET